MNTTLSLFFAGYSPANNIITKDENTCLVISEPSARLTDVIITKDPVNQTLLLADGANADESVWQQVFSTEEGGLTYKFEFDLSKIEALMEGEDPDLLCYIYEFMDRVAAVVEEISEKELLFTLRALKTEVPLQSVLIELGKLDSMSLSQLFECEDDFSTVQTFKELTSPTSF